jgi:hypothetical protein
MKRCFETWVVYRRRVDAQNSLHTNAMFDRSDTMSTATLSRISSRFTALTAVAALFAAAVLASMPVQANTIPAAKTHTEVKAEFAGPVSLQGHATATKPSLVQKDKVKSSGVQRSVEPGRLAGPYFERSTVRRSIGE